MLHLDVTGLNSPYDQKEHASNTIDTSPVYSSDQSSEYCSPRSEQVREQDEEIAETQYKRQGGGNVSSESVGSIQTHLDEEVIGIITMEDVMEELLQVPSNYIYIYIVSY